MTAHKRVLPPVSGLLLVIAYCLWTYWTVAGYLPVWSAGFLGGIGMAGLLWRTERLGVLPAVRFGVTRGTLVTLPAMGGVVVYSGVGGLATASLGAFRGDPMTGTAPGTQFAHRLAAVTPEGVTLPYSLFFERYLTGSISPAETYFALFVFDPFYLLIAIESLGLFVSGCLLSGLLIGRYGRASGRRPSRH